MRSRKIRIHPTDPNIVFVAELWATTASPSEERGVFKSTRRRQDVAEGRSTATTKTGAVDISIDRTIPNVMYAAIWEAYRIE